ncbi:unnamed protein product [Arabidopsis thaliana]|uniref:(thale cress) hypothetical protein n=1 Tax=Arabidopsis thaliana TaxID=3702 RepID=A0A7G2F3E9_ARATH|nr:unnamed protein product [Arabidopsis thaliana]
MELHGALVASPGMGHAVPILELGKHLLNHHGFDRVTVFLVTDDVSRSKSLIGKTLMEEDPKFVIRDDEEGITRDQVFSHGVRTAA